MLPDLDSTKQGGLVTVVTQDARTGAVLMVAHADREALERTLATGEMHYQSRTRGLWHKGATSGNVQRLVSLSADCDADAMLARVIPAGPGCHTGHHPVSAPRFPRIRRATSRTARRGDRRPGDNVREGDASYTGAARDRNLRLKKIGEESAELATALADGDRSRAPVEEASDLIYHVLVALRGVGVSLQDVTAELERRESPAR